MLFSLLGVRLISPQYKIRMQYNIHYSSELLSIKRNILLFVFFASHLIPSQEHRKYISAILALSEELFRWTPNRIINRDRPKQILFAALPSFTTSQRPFVVLSLLLLLILLFDSYWLRLRGETTKVFLVFYV